MNPHLEVLVVKRPVAEHLEERVMCVVLADLLEIVVLATEANALLVVYRPGQFAETRISIERLFVVQEDRLELIHAGVHQQRIAIGVQHRNGLHELMTTLGEVVHELLPHSIRGPFGRRAAVLQTA